MEWIWHLVSIDLENRKLEFAGAKNPLIYIQNNKLYQLKGDIMPIGGEQLEIERRFTLYEIDITQPTTFYLFSDGYQDQFGGKKGSKFMIKRLRELLFRHPSKANGATKRNFGTKHQRLDAGREGDSDR